MPPRKDTAQEGLREADHLKRTAEAVAILGPPDSGGIGALTRDDIRRYLRHKHEGFEFLVCEMDLAAPPQPLPPPSAIATMIAEEEKYVARDTWLDERGFPREPESLWNGSQEPEEEPEEQGEDGDELAVEALKAYQRELQEKPAPEEETS